MEQELEKVSNSQMILSVDAMAQISAIAEIMATGKATIPKHLQGSKGDCFAIAMQAASWNMSPFAVAQKTHLINGVLGYESQLVNAVVSSSKAIVGRFHYEYKGDWKVASDVNSMVRTGAKLCGEDEITWGEWLSPASVTTKNSPLWKTAPKQQSAYLVVKYWARMYCPEVILGVYSADEIVDAPIVEKDITPAPDADADKPQSRVEALKAKVNKNKTIENGEITLAFVCDEIAKATTLEELAKASELTATLNEHDLQVAREEYVIKNDSLKAK